MFKEPNPEQFGFPILKIDFHGTKHWFFNDELHREDGPAVEFSDGHKEWYLNGKLHRTNGPAIENCSGSKFWFLNGERYSEQDFEQKVKKYV